MTAARCHVCGFASQVLKDGTFRTHSRYVYQHHGSVRCEGAGQRADDARLAARGKVYRAAADARQELDASLVAIAVARKTIEREETRLQALGAKSAAAVEALAAFDREHPAGDVRRVPVDGGGA